MVWWVWPLLWMETARTPPRPEIDRSFAWCQRTMQTSSVSYRLYRPESIGQRELLPLLVWLHGRGEAGDNNRDQLAWLELVLGRHPRRVADHRLFVLALQCPACQPTWVGLRPGQPDPLQRLDWVLEETIRHEPIDRERVYVAGVSSGAAGCWELARRFPRRFAAVVPFASTSVDLRAVPALIDTPVWAFQSTADGRAPLQATANIIRALRLAGGRAHLTRVHSCSHDCWTAGFRSYRVSAWMLSQRRGRAIRWPPGLAPPRRSTAAVVALSIAVLCAAARRRAATWRPLRRGTCPPRSQAVHCGSAGSSRDSRPEMDG